MENKNKNILIGALLAVVFVMAVGYAAFAQQLTINGSAEISSRWDVHMTQVGASATPTFTNNTTTGGTVTVNEGGLTATFSATLISPGDKVTFVVPIENTGTLDARLNEITLSSDTDGMQISDLVATTQDGNIRYTVTSPGSATLVKDNGTAQVTVVAEFVNNPSGQGNAQNVTANLTVSMTYVQA